MKGNTMNMLSEMIGQTVECKIYGGFYHLTMVAYDTDTATVELPSGELRTLPVVASDGYRGADSCVIAPAVI
jgi:hypothetical protein